MEALPYLRKLKERSRDTTLKKLDQQLALVEKDSADQKTRARTMSVVKSAASEQAKERPRDEEAGDGKEKEEVDRMVELAHQVHARKAKVKEMERQRELEVERAKRKLDAQIDVYTSEMLLATKALDQAGDCLLERLAKCLEDLKSGDLVASKTHEGAWEIARVKQMDRGYNADGSLKWMVLLSNSPVPQEVTSPHSPKDFSQKTFLPLSLTFNDQEKLKELLRGTRRDAKPLLVLPLDKGPTLASGKGEKKEEKEEKRAQDGQSKEGEELDKIVELAREVNRIRAKVREAERRRKLISQLKRKWSKKINLTTETEVTPAVKAFDQVKDALMERLDKCLEDLKEGDLVAWKAGDRTWELVSVVRMDKGFDNGKPDWMVKFSHLDTPKGFGAYPTFETLLQEAIFLPLSLTFNNQVEFKKLLHGMYGDAGPLLLVDPEQDAPTA